MPSTTLRFAFALLLVVTATEIANARPQRRHRATLALTDSNFANAQSLKADEESCHDTGRTIAAGLGDHVEVVDDSFLRARIGRDSSEGRNVAKGIRVVVRAVDRADHAILVEDPRGNIGWVSPCEIAGVARHVDDLVEAIRAGSMRSRARDGRSIMPIAVGAHLTVLDWDADSVLVEASDGMRGWFPAAALETITDADAVWQPGLAVQWPCKGKHHGVAGALRCGEDDLHVVTSEQKRRSPRVLLVAPDGRWGWVADRLESVETTPPVIAPDNSAVPAAEPADEIVATTNVETTVSPAMAGIVMEHAMPAQSSGSTENAPPAQVHEMVMAGMAGAGAPSQGASLSLLLQTAMPVGDAMADPTSGPGRTPRYEASVTATGGGRIDKDDEYGITAVFGAAGSLTTEGQNLGEQYEGGSAIASVARRLNKHCKLALGAGYALAFVSPGEMADPEWDFIAIHPGPIVKLSLTGDFTHWSYSLLGSAQWTTGMDGMSGTIIVADAMAMVPLASWASLRVDTMWMEMAMGDTMVSASPGVSFAFLDRLSATVGVTAMESSGMTMWTATTGLGAHF